MGSGFEHPLSGPDHFLAMVVVGLWGALTGGRPVKSTLRVSTMRLPPRWQSATSTRSPTWSGWTSRCPTFRSSSKPPQSCHARRSGALFATIFHG
ncbi:HupE/UreJ family protein [Amorphus orientalis]|uniref:HupE/UreJ family protein n=1 Tax=Amorphus orientalis TaxID=649198 RepID=UPI00351FA680